MTLFSTCYSPKKLFQSEVEDLKSKSEKSTEVFTENDFKNLPDPIRRYFMYCGFIGKEKQNSVEVVWENSYIKMSPKKKWMKLKTRQFNFIKEPARLAYMKAKLFGIIPFEGRDKYCNGHGHMYGTIGRIIKIFDAKQPEIAQSALVVIFAESLIFPNYALQENIIWEPVDSLTVKARFIHKGIVISGRFCFNEKGEYIRFFTEDRYYMNNDGTFEKKPYTIVMDAYKEKNGIIMPTEVKAIWNLEDGDYVYWKGVIKEIRGI